MEISKPLKEHMWAFAWKCGKPYITSEIAWYRRDVIREVTSSHGELWATIYKRGGRVIKVTVTEAIRSRRGRG